MCVTYVHVSHNSVKDYNFLCLPSCVTLTTLTTYTPPPPPPSILPRSSLPSHVYLTEQLLQLPVAHRQANHFRYIPRIACEMAFGMDLWFKQTCSVITIQLEYKPSKSFSCALSSAVVMVVRVVKIGATLPLWMAWVWSNFRK